MKGECYEASTCVELHRAFVFPLGDLPIDVQWKDFVCCDESSIEHIEVHWRDLALVGFVGEGER